MLLKKLGQPIMTNLYYNTVKSLLERASSVLVDAEAVEVLLGFIIELLQGEAVGGDLHIDPSRGSLKGLTLLQVLLQLIFFGDRKRKLIRVFLAVVGNHQAAPVPA
jgi:sister-chromatid-cohesion protein PDS5